MTIIITLTQRYDGADGAIATWLGPPFAAISRHGVTMALARLLVAAGCPDQPWKACWPDGRLRFSGKSLHSLARLTIAESDRGIRTMPFNAKDTRHWDAPDGVKSEPGPRDRVEP